jgi:salicylate hydroxylase
VQVFEQVPVFAPVGAGIQLGPNATRVLHSLGLESALRAVAAFPSELQVRSGTDARLLGVLPLGDRALARYGAPYATLARADLHQLLLTALEAQSQASLYLGSPIDAAQQDSSAVQFSTADGMVRRVEVMAAADGLWSRLRSQVLLDTPAVATRAQQFYRRAGFEQITREQLPVPYEYPDRDSLLFLLRLPDHSVSD